MKQEEMEELVARLDRLGEAVEGILSNVDVLRMRLGKLRSDVRDCMERHAAARSM
jgi:hypothetical protein